MAEAFLMEALSEADALAFEEHLMVCAACRAAVQQADPFVRAIAEAAAQIRKQEAKGPGMIN